MELPIYLDNNATTRVDPRVLDEMVPYFSEIFGNASSKTHGFGWQASEAVDLARDRVAGLIGSKPREVIFTGGATEANNMAILGAAEARGRAGHIITSAVEHPAVLDPAAVLEKRGFQVTRIRPDSTGWVDPNAVREAMSAETFLVSIMIANNEIGTVNPLADISAIAKKHGAIVHADGAQAVGKIPVDVEKLGLDLLSFTAHKFYGPKGVGALYVKGGKPGAIQPIVFGGGQERGLRSGTLSVPLIVGLGSACQVSHDDLEHDMKHSARLAHKLRDGLASTIGPRVAFNGHTERCLPGTVHVTFAGIESQALLMAMPEVALSTGSACSSAETTLSHVLTAIGMRKVDALGSVRFGVGRFNTDDDIDYVLKRIPEQLAKLKR